MSRHFKRTAQHLDVVALGQPGCVGKGAGAAGNEINHKPARAFAFAQRQFCNGLKNAVRGKYA